MTVQQTFRNTLVVVLTVAGAYVVYRSLHILIVLLIAVIIASAVRPAVMRVSKGRIPNGLAILMVYVALGLSLFLLGIVVLPPAISQLSDYLTNDQGLATKLNDAQTTIVNGLGQINVHITPIDPLEIKKTVSSTVKDITATIPSLASDFAGTLGDFVLVVVMGVYWLTGRDEAVNFVLQLFSLERRATIGEVITEIESSLGAYVRGVISVAFFVGVANFAILSLLRVPNAVTLGFIVGVTTILPLIGGYIGAGTATLLALVSSPINALFALGSFVAVQQVENHYLTPRVMSRSVGLNPILVIVFLFVGFALDGVVGGLIAVPIAGMVSVILRHLVIEPRKGVAAPQMIDGGILLPSSIKSNVTPSSPVGSNITTASQ